MLSERWFPSIGGGEEHIYNLTQELVRLGCEITLISRSLTSQNKDAPYTENLHNGNLKVYRLMPKTRFDNLIGRASYIPFSLVKSLAMKERFDLIHAQSFSACLPALMLKSVLKKPAICTVHGIYQDAWYDLLESKPKADLYKKIERFVLFRNYDRIITVDKHFISVSKAYGYPLDKVRYISNGVDVKSFSGDEKERRGGRNDFLFVGRLIPQKGLEYLIRASKILKDENIEHQILVVGDGPLKSELRGLASKLEIEDTVKFLGRISSKHLRSTYSQARFFILPSLWEGLPITLLEAWASGLPVIATKVGGIPDVCVHMENSLLVRPKDSKALAESMRFLMGDEALSRKLGTQGRMLVKERFTWEKVAEKTLGVYKEITEGH